MTQFLEEQKILSANQFGCRKGHSTQSALLYLLQSIKTGADKGLVTILVLFDLCKAFDSVNHKILLQTLKHYNY